MSPKFGMCKVSVSPLRKVASDRSEMVSQLLFGECAEILERKGRSWIYVRVLHDGYEAWMDPKQLHFFEEKDLEKYQSANHIALELVESVKSTGQALPILMGSSLPKFDGLTMKLPFGKFQYSGLSISLKEPFNKVDILLNIAKKYLHAPYLWGGRSPFGIDCSGYVQVVFKTIGYSLPRDTKEQVAVGEAVNFVTEVLPGDLAFFQNQDGRIHHVGIMLEQGRILHASGKVRLDPLDQYGIYNNEVKKYTHRLRIIKRLDIGLGSDVDLQHGNSV